MTSIETAGPFAPDPEHGRGGAWSGRVLADAQAQARGGEEVGLICLALPRRDMESLLAPFKEVGMLLLPARHREDGSPWILALAAGHTHCTYRSLFREVPCARGWFSYASVGRGELFGVVRERWALVLTGEGPA